MDNTRMENTVQELANIQSQCQELIDRIREIEKEIEQTNEPKLERVKKGEVYFLIGFANGRAVVCTEREDYCTIDNDRFNNNHYFKTHKRAQEVADKINFLLKLERLHDTFCPDDEPKLERVKKGEVYFLIGFANGRAVVCTEREDYCTIDDDRFNNNHYFKTHKRAQEVADKINFLLKLERLHDTFCPDYVPDWNSDEAKFTIYYNHIRIKPRYEVQPYCYMRHPTTVYFPSAEIAQKVCDILNKERENNG